ncbi:unnamed protein product, partial [Prorocentrum cordatum]
GGRVAVQGTYPSLCASAYLFPPSSQTLRFEEDPDAAACEDPGAVCVYAATPRASARRSRGARRTGSCRGRARGGARRRRWSSTSRAAWTPRRAGRCSRCGTSCARRCTLSARWWQGAPRLRGNVGGGRCTATPLPFPRFRLFGPPGRPSPGLSSTCVCGSADTNLHETCGVPLLGPVWSARFPSPLAVMAPPLRNHLTVHRCPVHRPMHVCRMLGR